MDVLYHNIGTSGVVATFCCDEQGLYLGASSPVLLGVADPTTLEALACREDLALARDLYIQRLHIALDC